MNLGMTRHLAVMLTIFIRNIQPHRNNRYEQSYEADHDICDDDWICGSNHLRHSVRRIIPKNHNIQAISPPKNARQKLT